jgi:hypothetical protein
MDDLLERYLSKTLNIDSSKLAELVKNEDGELKKDALKILLGEDATRVQGLKSADETELKTRFDNGYAKAKKESLGLFEKDIKANFEISSDNKGLDLITEIVSAKTKSNGTEITPDIVKTSKTYLDMVDLKNTEQSTKVKEVENKYLGEISTYKRQGSLSIVNKKASAIVDTLNPILSKDPAKASNQKQVIFDQFAKINFKVEDDRVILLNKEGNLLEDSHRNPIKFEDKIEEITVGLYDLNESKKRSSAGADDDDDDKKKGKDAFKWNGQAPKNKKEYSDLVNAADSLEEKKAIMASWNESQSND